MIAAAGAAALLAVAVMVWPDRQGSGAPALGPVARAGRGVDGRPSVPAPAPRGPGWFRWWGGRVRPSRARHDPTRAEVELGRFLDTVATALDAGLPTSGAVRSAVQSSMTAAASAELEGLCRSLLHATETGRPTGPVWRAAAGRSGGALAMVAAAWAMSEELGTPLAEGVRAGSRACRERADRQRAVAVLTAGPVATIRLLTVLPIAGPGMVVLLGLASPQDVSPVMVVSLLSGGVLLLLGRWWARALTSRALRPPTV